jgi:hypothetical protein
MLPETQTILPDFEKYQSDPLYAYLNKKVITLPGKPPFVPERKLLIMESCGLLSFRRGNLKAEVGLRPADSSSFALEKLYVPLAACSFGDVPTADEFLALPDADIDIWINEARQINPQYFEWLDAAQKVIAELNEDRLKKKEKKPQKSVSG